MATDPNTPVYLDYNATAIMLPQARAAMMEAQESYPGNPSSPHRFGQAARSALEAGRARIAHRLGVERRDVIFTSGGSESNNTVLRSAAGLKPAGHIIISPLEHPSVLAACERLEAEGVAISRLPVDSEGRVEPSAVGALMRPDTRLVSVMTANNETGVIQPLPELVEQVRKHEGGRRVPVHTDAVQAFGRIPLPLAAWDVDYATITAHKLGGPKGIGALVCRDARPVSSLIVGGAQERGMRAGTESVFLVEGFATAADWACDHLGQLASRLNGFRDALESGLDAETGFFINGAGARRVPNTMNLGFEGVSAESLVIALDLAGVAISTGSACSSGAMEPSHVLMAMNVPPHRLESAVRISMGHGTREEDMDRCGDALAREARRLRDIARERAS